jgi:hypothetical protein
LVSISALNLLHRPGEQITAATNDAELAGVEDRLLDVLRLDQYEALVAG